MNICSVELTPKELEFIYQSLLKIEIPGKEAKFLVQLQLKLEQEFNSYQKIKEEEEYQKIKKLKEGPNKTPKKSSNKK